MKNGLRVLTGHHSVESSYSDTVFSYTVFIVSCFVALVVHMLVFFLQVELDPVVKTHDLIAIFGFSHKYVFKSTGILTSMKNKSFFQRLVHKTFMHTPVHSKIKP